MKPYLLRIDVFDRERQEAINRILGLEVPVEEGSWWQHDVSWEEMDQRGTYFIDYYAGLILPALPALKEIGVEKGDITVWFFYEYEEQCNMAFDPERMALLSRMEATLCISCWQK